MADRTEILDRLFVDAEQFMLELIESEGIFTNLQILKMVAQTRQKAYIDLLSSYRDTENRSPFNAAHQDIGQRIYNVAIKLGYERAKDLDYMGEDIFDNPSKAKCYRLKN